MREGNDGTEEELGDSSCENWGCNRILSERNIVLTDSKETCTG